jgi:hypothetical protein
VRLVVQPVELDGVLFEVGGSVEEKFAGLELLGFEAEAEEVGVAGSFPGDGEEAGEGVADDGNLEGVLGVEGGGGELEEGGLAVEGGEGDLGRGGGELEGEDGGGFGGRRNDQWRGEIALFVSGNGGKEEAHDGERCGQEEGAEEWAAVHGWSLGTGRC